jgi:uncharacterized protein
VNRRRALISSAVFVLALVITAVSGARPDAALVGSPNVVISQVYGGGGNSGATLKNDFIELYNRGTTDVDLGAWSVQYASTTGTSWQRTNLTGSIAAGGYYLVQEDHGTGGTVDLPTPDATGTIAMAAGAGKVALVQSQTTIANGTSCPASTVDLVGYGTSTNCFETGPTANLSNTTAALRKGNGATDTDNNSADFTVGAPNPRNRGETAPSVTGRIPAPGSIDADVSSNVTITFSEPVTVTGSWYSLSCSTSGPHTATVSGGPTTFTLNPDADFAANESCVVTIFAAGIADQDANDPPDNPAADDSWTFTTSAPQPVTPIHDIQGASQVSSKSGQTVSNVQGIVIAATTNGFWMQDPSPDADPATSEGIFVFTASAPTAAVGDAVAVRGRVQEFRPGGTDADNSNLTTTELASPTVSVLSSGNPMPAATIVGTGGRIPPSETIEDDATGGSVESGNTFDPAADGLDFWESLEGMRVQLNNAVAVGPTNSFGETPVVGDNGANAGVRTVRGGVLLRANDGNPERVFADDSLAKLPELNVGDHYTGQLVGVLDYNFGNFFLEVTSSVDGVHDGVTQESTIPATANELAVATFNVENLAPSDPQSKFDRLAALFVHNLGAPDIVSVEEVQDNSGATDNGVVAADQTLQKLIGAITAAGGPAYQYREIDPVNDADGGQPGGNIRQVFLFRTDRGVAFVDRAGGGSTTATAVVDGPNGPELSASPGRIAPQDGAWTSSRKPLAGEFTFHGHHLFVIANHFNSKGGDQALMGRYQPPTRISEVQRHQQAQLVHDFVASILAKDPNANVVVDGDLNDFEFSDTVSILKSGDILDDLIDALPENQRYSYEFEGNAQVLDHILMSNGLTSRPFIYDVVHVNSEFSDQASDHDPSVAHITLADAPTVSAGGPYTVAEGSSTTLTATTGGGTDPLSVAWDLDNNGTYEAAGASVSFTGLDGQATVPVHVRVTDGDARVATADSTVTVTNVDPMATFHAPASVSGGFDIAVSLTDPHDVAADLPGLTYAFDCGSGSFGVFSSTATASCPTANAVPVTVRGAIRDKDGGETHYSATVSVTVTFDSLCALVRSWSTSADVADGLCSKLAAAADAAARGNANAKSNQLRAFKNQVETQTGKAFTADQAATLARLAGTL